jgi:hypothetical protein
MVGHRRDRDDAARPRDRAAVQRRRQRARRHQPRARHGQVRQTRLWVSTITGQGNGQGGREHGHKCDQLPGNRDITNPEHRAARRVKVWECDESEIPGKGIPAQEIIEAIHAGDHQGPAVDLLQPAVSRPTSNFTREALDQARVLQRHRLLRVRVGPPRRHRPARLAARGGRRHLHQSGEGRIIKINAAVEPPGEARLDWQILVDIAERLGKRQVLPVHRHPTDLRRTPPRVRRRHRRLPRRDVGTHRSRIRAVLADPEEGHPGTPRLYEGGGSTTPTAERSSTRCRTKCPARSSTTTTRCGSPPGGSSASTCRAPRPAASLRSSISTPSRCARCTRGSPKVLGCRRRRPRDGHLATR